MDVVVSAGSDQVRSVKRTKKAKTARAVQSRAEAIDGVVVALPNFGDERAMRTPFDFPVLGVPVWYKLRGYSGKHGNHHRRDSFCGKMSACNNLPNMDPYSLTHCTRKRRIPRVRKDLDGSQAYAASCVTADLRIGAIGARRQHHTCV